MKLNFFLVTFSHVSSFLNFFLLLLTTAVVFAYRKLYFHIIIVHKKISSRAPYSFAYASKTWENFFSREFIIDSNRVKRLFNHFSTHTRIYLHSRSSNIYENRFSPNNCGLTKKKSIKFLYSSKCFKKNFKHVYTVEILHVHVCDAIEATQAVYG